MIDTVTAESLARAYLARPPEGSAPPLLGFLAEFDAICELAAPRDELHEHEISHIAARSDDDAAAYVDYDLTCRRGALKQRSTGHLVLQRTTDGVAVADVANEHGSLTDHLFRLDVDHAEGLTVDAFIRTRTDGGIVAVAVTNTGAGAADIRLRLGRSTFRQMKLPEGARAAQVVLIPNLSWFRRLTILVARGDNDLRLRAPIADVVHRQLPSRAQALLQPRVFFAVVPPLAAVALALAAVIAIASGYGDLGFGFLAAAFALLLSKRVQGIATRRRATRRAPS